MSTVTETDLIARAESWLGTPWRHRARVPGAGVDCLQLICDLAELAGIDPGPAARRHYSRDPQDRRLAEYLGDRLDRVPVDARRAGDVLLFGWATLPQHLGLLDARGNIIHAYESAGGVVRTPLRGEWLRALRGVYRVPGLAGRG